MSKSEENTLHILAGKYCNERSFDNNNSKSVFQGNRSTIFDAEKIIQRIMDAVIIFAIIGFFMGLIAVIKGWYWLSFTELILRFLLLLCAFTLVGAVVAWLLL